MKISILLVCIVLVILTLARSASYIAMCFLLLGMLGGLDLSLSGSHDEDPLLPPL